MGMANTKAYFATRSSTDIGKHLMERLRPLVSDETHANREEMRIAYAHVYGREVGYGIPSAITRGGQRGELALFRMNSGTSVARAKHALVTSNKLTWKAQAKNGSASAAKAVPLANDILEDQWKNNNLSSVVSQWSEQTVFFGASYVFTEWDRGKGPPLAMGTSGRVNQGEVVYHNIPPWDVFYDNAAPAHRSLLWKFARLYTNRFELAATCKALVDGRTGQEAEDAIVSAQGTEILQDVSTADRERFKESELIPVWYFFHEPCASLPMGRLTVLVNDTVVLTDEPIRGPKATYEGVPLYRMVDKEMVGGPHGYAIFWDTMGNQEIQDAIDTSLATRATTLGNPVIAYEAGSDVKPESLGNGFTTWKYPRQAKPPAEIATVKVPQEMLAYRKDLQGNQRQTMGMNDVALGQPQGAQMNAQAFAVLASMAVQQASPFQDNILAAVSALGRGVLKLFCKRVPGKRALQSSRDSASVTQWTGSDLADIENVSVEIGNPMEQTAAGRKAILDDKMAKGWVTTPEQYDQVLSTGRSEPASRRNTAEMTLIQWEVEQLKQGKLPPVHHAHNHALHFREGSAAIMDPQASPQVIQVVEQFLEQHYQLQFGVPRQGDPLAGIRESWMLGQPPGPGQEMPPTPPPGIPGAPTGPGGPPPPSAEQDANLPPDAVPPEAADVPPPDNPLTGQAFNPVDGGGVVPN